MAEPMVRVAVKVNAQVALTKLEMAAPRILARNRLLTEDLLKEVKGIVYVQTPLGPGHFGYHGRDTLGIKVSSKGMKTTGRLTAAVQLGWRERGTSRGERPRYTAKKALAYIKRFISAYYGGMANWWRS